MSESRYIIAPSILSADPTCLGKEVAAVIEAGADFIHIDVMDNHYVPNLSFGPAVVSALRKRGIRQPLDVHLMVKPVDRIAMDFAKAGASYISFHPEASEHVHRSLQSIRDAGCRAGLVLNPATPLCCLNHVLEQLDLILLMSVNPGFSGQTFIESVLPKIREARDIIERSDRTIRLEVDGGIRADNIRQIAEAGADTFVLGSAVFDSTDYHLAIKKLRSQLETP